MAGVMPWSRPRISDTNTEGEDAMHCLTTGYQGDLEDSWLFQVAGETATEPTPISRRTKPSERLLICRSSSFSGSRTAAPPSACWVPGSVIWMGSKAMGDTCATIWPVVVSHTELERREGRASWCSVNICSAAPI